MKKLKSVVPEKLKLAVAESNTEVLPSTCSSLVEFFINNKLFHKVVADLTDPGLALCGKNKDNALLLKQQGNENFLKGCYREASNFYSQALRAAPIDNDDMGNNLVAVLYVNRASSFYNMGLFAECLRDCDRALQISPSYAKVWYRRGKTNASLKNFDVAHRDLNIAMNLELSVAGKRQVKCELELIAKKHKMAKTPRFCGANTADDTYQIKLESVSTPTKGRGMASFTDISPASLIHREEPYAAVVLKKYRESHCHFCFNELSSDTVPCTSCSIPLYCSEHCQVQARGRALRNYEGNCPILETLPCDLKKHVALVARVRDFDSNVHYVPEHSHECGGLHWPAIFPSEIVLAGRILIKSRELSGGSTRSFNPFATSELCHNYSQMSAANKLELHVYSVVLLYCLHQSHGSELPLCGVSVSQLVLLICQVRVNSLAIVRMKSIDAHGPLDQYENCSKATDALTSTVEQVKVAQALYISGSLFNHSCQPNLHVYFRSRTLFIRTTEFVPAGCPLELSYGPQVGQWDCKDRRKFLQDEYSFECHCNGCSEVNMSDIVLNAFRCVDPKCSGVILDSRLTKYDLQAISKVCKLQDGTVKVSDHIFNDVGRCINCGSYRDLESSISMVNDAQICIKRLQDSIASKEVSVDILSDALRGLGLLRSTLHAYNKDIAEAEDNIAQAFCLIGELRTAMHHCEASIRILEKLYRPNHIVIGFELLKLSSIQLSLGDCATAETINRCDAIFSLYFGPHADAIFPYLQALKADASKMVCSTVKALSYFVCTVRLRGKVRVAVTSKVAWRERAGSRIRTSVLASCCKGASIRD